MMPVSGYICSLEGSTNQSIQKIRLHKSWQVKKSHHAMICSTADTAVSPNLYCKLGILRLDKSNTYKSTYQNARARSFSPWTTALSSGSEIWMLYQRADKRRCLMHSGQFAHVTRHTSHLTSISTVISCLDGWLRVVTCELWDEQTSRQQTAERRARSTES